MAMKITQEYMDKEVIKPMKEIEKKIDAILDEKVEEKIDLLIHNQHIALSNTALLVREFDKIMKNLKKK